ncbi:unnamed protein product, partial [Ectocarpus sp. 12 AP-2014]
PVAFTAATPFPGPATVGRPWRNVDDLGGALDDNTRPDKGRARYTFACATVGSGAAGGTPGETGGDLGVVAYGVGVQLDGASSSTRGDEQRARRGWVGPPYLAPLSRRKLPHGLLAQDLPLLAVGDGLVETHRDWARVAGGVDGGEPLVGLP